MSKDEMRARTLERFTSLRQLSVFPDLLDLLATYVGAVIPGRPSASAGEQWIITSLPTTSSWPGTTSLTRVSVNIVETLFLAGVNGDETRGLVVGYLNVSPDTQIPPSFAERTDRTSYRLTGQVSTIEFETLEELAQLLEDPKVMKGASKLTDELFHSGRSPHARYHDYNLSDAIQEVLDSRT